MTNFNQSMKKTKKDPWDELRICIPTFSSMEFHGWVDITIPKDPMDKNSWVPDSGSFLQPSADNAIGLANNEAKKTMPVS